MRRKGQRKGGEAEIPVHEAINGRGRMGERILEILMRNVSTMTYLHVIPELAETVGASESTLSRAFINQSVREFKLLFERRFYEMELLIDSFEFFMKTI